MVDQSGVTKGGSRPTEIRRLQPTVPVSVGIGLCEPDGGPVSSTRRLTVQAYSNAHSGGCVQVQVLPVRAILRHSTTRRCSEQGVLS